MFMIVNSLYNNIVPPSQLPQKANYYLFKEGIIPAWEDEANKNGGKWSIQLPRDKNKANVDKMWLYTVSFVTLCENGVALSWYIHNRCWPRLAKLLIHILHRGKNNRHNLLSPA